MKGKTAKGLYLVSAILPVIMMLIFSAAPALAEAEEWAGNKTFLIRFSLDIMANDWQAVQVREVEEVPKK